MAHWEDAWWEPSTNGGLRRRDRRGGDYATYVPDLLASIELSVPPDLDASLAAAERAVRTLVGSPGASDLDRLSRFLLRSEAIASSMIEGVAPSSRQIAIAELADAEDEPVRRASEQAHLVASNIRIIRRATAELAQDRPLTSADVVGLHRSLVPPEHHGFRTVQNWIGGSRWHPLDAEFVPPAPTRVPELVADIVSYMNGATHAPLVQAALTHAQFETVHPFTDGNGRVGRALIHTVLARRGLTANAVLPVSIVLATLSDAYVRGLTAFRHATPPGSEAARRATVEWLRVFTDATITSVDQARLLVAEIAALREEWTERLATWRSAQGVRPTPRADSATARLLVDLPETPVVTVGTVARSLGVSVVAARQALEELHGARILTTRSLGQGTTGYMSDEVLELVDFAERQLASTRFDTRAAAPTRAVPALPGTTGGGRTQRR